MRIHMGIVATYTQKQIRTKIFGAINNLSPSLIEHFCHMHTCIQHKHFLLIGLVCCWPWQKHAIGWTAWKDTPGARTFSERRVGSWRIWFWFVPRPFVWSTRANTHTRVATGRVRRFNYRNRNAWFQYSSIVGCKFVLKLFFCFVCVFFTLLCCSCQNFAHIQYKVALKRWWNGHIINDDSAFASHLESASPESSDKIDVYDCLDTFTQEETLEESEAWYCSTCKKHMVKQKKIQKNFFVVVSHLSFERISNPTCLSACF